MYESSPATKGNAGRAPQPRRADARDGKTQQQGERREDPACAHSFRHAAHGLHDALQHADLVLAHRNQQGERRADVQQAGEHSAPGHRTRQGALRVLDFVAHDRGQFQTHQSKTNYAKRVEHETRVCRDPEISHAHGRAKSHPDHQSQANQRGRGDSGSNAAQIVDPLPYAQAHDIEHHQNDQQKQRRHQRKRLVVRQRLMVGAEDKHRYADEVQHDRRDVKHVVRPVAPAREEAVEVAEHFLGPQIDAAFSGIAVGQFDDGDALRPEEQQRAIRSTTRP